MKKELKKYLFNMKENFKNKKILPIILLIVLLSIVGSLSYAIWNKTLTSNQNTITSGVVSMSFTESSNTITINNALPMGDSEGQVLTSYFDFSVTSNLTLNNGDPNSSVNYNIEIEPLSVDSGYTALTNDQIKVYLENITNGTTVLVNPTLISNLSTSTTGKILYNTSHVHSYGVNIINTKYRLRAWIDMDVSANDFKTTSYEYKFRLNINGEEEVLSKPQILNTSLNDLTVSAEIKSNEEIKYFGFSNDSNTEPSTWIESNNYLTLNQNNNYNLNYTFNDSGTYYLWLKDKSNNIINYNESFIIIISPSFTSLGKLNYTANDINNLSTNFWNQLINDNDDITTNDSGIYSFTDDYGTSYVYRGHINNNWVKFAGFYWRIVRIIGNGDIRMIYAGSAAPTELTQYVKTGDSNSISTDKYNNYSGNDNAYIGYMYGTTSSSSYENTHKNLNNSKIKTYIENWYKTNLVSYDSLISDSYFCYDRSLYSGTGIGTNKTYYRASRISSAGPTLICSQANDMFTVSSQTINSKTTSGVNTYKIGILSVDEASLAGLIYSDSTSNADTNNYLYTNTNYWLGTAYAYISNLYPSLIFNVSSKGIINYAAPTNTLGYRPVINISKDVSVTGDGTYLHPYEFTLN